MAIFAILNLTGAIQVADVVYQVLLLALPAIMLVVEIWAKPTVANILLSRKCEVCQ